MLLRSSTLTLLKAEVGRILLYGLQASNKSPSCLLAAPSSQWSPSLAAASCRSAASFATGAASGSAGPPSPAPPSMASANGFRLHSGQVRARKRCVSNHFSAEQFDAAWLVIASGQGVGRCVRTYAGPVVVMFADWQ